MGKVLVTGGAGFIGSHTVDVLLARGEEVVALDNFNDYYDPTWKRSNIREALTSKNYILVEGDFLDKPLLDQIFYDHTIDRIIHLGARAGVRPSIAEPQLYQKVNIEGTVNLLEKAKEYRHKNFVMASSSSVYGNQTKTPFSETDPVDQPISPYAATKRAGELLAYTYHHLYDLPVTMLRFFTVYGERGRPDMAPYLFTYSILTGRPIKKFGDGTAARDYTYVGNIVRGILASLDRAHPYAIINLGSDSPITLNNFIALIERLTGKQALIEPAPPQPGDVQQTWADLTLAHQLLDYQPQYSLEEGMERFIVWFKNERLPQLGS